MGHELTTRKVNGYTNFFLGERDITLEWMDFFSTLPMERERDCVKWFYRSKIYRDLMKNMTPTNIN